MHLYNKYNQTTIEKASKQNSATYTKKPHQSTQRILTVKKPIHRNKTTEAKSKASHHNTAAVQKQRAEIYTKNQLIKKQKNHQSTATLQNTKQPKKTNRNTPIFTHENIRIRSFELA
jgi:hypothetical protein